MLRLGVAWGSGSGVLAAGEPMHYDRNCNPEWGYVAPAPGFIRTARLIVVAVIVGATAGAVMVFSLLDRPVAQESIAARTLVAPNPSRTVTVGTSVAAQQPTDWVKSPAEAQNSVEQKAPSAPAAGATTRPQQSKLATTSTSQRQTSAAELAEAPAVKDTPSAQTLNNTVAVAPDPKPQSKKLRMTSRLASRNGARRYASPRNGYEPHYERLYGFAQGRGSFAWAPYGNY
jgi:hypothetical protein